MIAFANEKASDFNSTLKILHGAQSFDIISVTDMDERIDNRFIRRHHIYVAVARETIVHYIFVSGNGNDYLDRIEVLNQTFEQTILEVWKQVRTDGQCSMTISPF